MSLAIMGSGRKNRQLRGGITTSNITGNILSNDRIGVMFCCKKCGKYFFRYVSREEYYFHYWDEDYKKDRNCAVCQLRSVRDWCRRVKRKF